MDYLKDVVFIGSLWAHIVVFGLILSVAFEDQFDMIWPILPGLAWLPFWWPIHRIAVEKAGFSLALEQDLGGLPPYIELPWWSSLTFKLIVLVVLIGASYGISYVRSNR